MKLFKKESKQKKETRSLPMGKKSRSAFAVYAALVLMLCCCTTTAFPKRKPKRSVLLRKLRSPQKKPTTSSRNSSKRPVKIRPSYARREIGHE